MKMFTPNMPVVVFSNNLIEEGVDKNEIVVVCTDKENVWACSCNIPFNFSVFKAGADGNLMIENRGKETVLKKKER